MHGDWMTGTGLTASSARVRGGEGQGVQAGPERVIEESFLPEAAEKPPREFGEGMAADVWGDAVAYAPQLTLHVATSTCIQGGELLGADPGGPYLHWVAPAERAVGGEVVAADREGGGEEGRGRRLEVGELDPIHHPHAAEEGPLLPIQAQPHQHRPLARGAPARTPVPTLGAEGGLIPLLRPGIR